ncbi:hypothetical protein [Cryptosporangium sp. NPDC048952]|uniref:hypothetical protein n=1 Tax=Cryptosporangium sp. NPDC048952 TaxID=3363961 RepID=UPI003718C777
MHELSAHRPPVSVRDWTASRLLWVALVAGAIEAGRTADRYYPGVGIGVAVVGAVALLAAARAGR